MTTTTIDIGRDFSEVPSGRFPADGEFNGERFRKELLVPALKRSDRVVIDIDGTEGFGSSFLEEAFGGLVRSEGFAYDELERKLVISSKSTKTERYRRKIIQYIKKAK